MRLVRINPPHPTPPRMLGYATTSSPQQEVARCVTTFVSPDAATTAPLISVVIPAKNEADSLPTLLAEIAATFRELRHIDPATQAPGPVTFEVVVVDDGSADQTRQVLQTLAQSYPWLRAIHSTSSVGQSSCLIAGMRQSRGTWIATLDADLQNHPADLKLLWEALDGYDAALGWRLERKDSWSKRLISRLANRVRNFALGQAIQDTGCALRIFPRTIALRLPAFQGMHRFVGPLLLREGCRIIQVPVRHRARLHGRSHYTLSNRSWNVLLDLAGVIWLMHRPILHDKYSCSVPAVEAGLSSEPTSVNALDLGAGEQAPETTRAQVITRC